MKLNKSTQALFAGRRVPWRRSSEDRDCGAAAFASVASHYGYHLTTEEARDIVRTDRTGTSMRWICEGARQIGLSARGVRATYDGLAHLTLPTIVHFDEADGHYVVLTEHGRSGVNLIDPQIGRFRMKRAAFERAFSGFAVAIDRTERFEAKEPIFRSTHECARIVRAAWFPLLLMSLLMMAGTAVTLLITQQLGSTIDAALRGQQVSLVGVGATLLGASLAVSIGLLTRLWLAGRIGERIESELGRRFLDAINDAPVRNFEERCPVAFGGRVVETRAVASVLTLSLTDLVGSVLVGGLAATVLFKISTSLGVAALVIVPLLFLLSRGATRFGRMVEFEGMRREYRFVTRLVDTFTEFHTVKMFNAGTKEVVGMAQRFDDVAATRRRLVLTRGAPELFSMFVTAIATTAVVLVVANLATQQAITPGDAILAFGAAGVAFQSVRQVPTMLVRWEEAKLSLDRILEIVYMPGEPTGEITMTSSGVSPSIDFEDVSFSYDGHTPVLSGLDLRITPGERVAIVGRTGSGKTSVARLLARFDEPASGRILFDGATIASIDPAGVRSRVNVVFQGQRLLMRPLWENLTLGATAVDDAGLWAALEAAGVADVVTAQRLGLRTHAARAGRNFSAGQGQRLALARSLLRDPDVLILDEATANVDSQLESQILTDVLATRQDRTTIVISHRLATLHHVDRIVVLDEGRVAADGTLSELMERPGVFREVFEQQLATTPSTEMA